MSKVKDYINGYTNASLNEKLLYLFFLVCPSLIFVSLQSYVKSGSFIFQSIILGAALGAVAVAVLKAMSPSVFKGNYAMKYLALLSPVILLFSFATELKNSTNIYCIFFIVFAILLFIGFIYEIEDTSKKVCVTVVMLCMMFAVEYSLYTYDLFSPDSFSYYDISKTIFSDFYHVSTQRQYVYDTDLGISFPYLYPLFMAIFNAFTGLEIYSGTVFNIIIACFSCYLLYKISTKHFGNPFVGTVAAVFLMTNKPYLTEMRVARSVPLAVFCILILAYFILDLPKISFKSCLLAGLGAGGAMVCRFDALVAAGMCGLALLIFAKKGTKIKCCIFYAAGILILTLPWILFSLINFGSIFISDNSGTIFMPTPLIPQKYYSTGYVPTTMFNNFDYWYKMLFDYKLKYVWEYGLSKCLSATSLYVLLLFDVSIVLGFTRGLKFKEYVKSNKKTLIAAGFAILTYLAKTFAIVIVGFCDDRYHSETWLMVIMFLTAVFVSIVTFSTGADKSHKTNRKKAKLGTSFLSAAVTLVAVITIVCTVNEYEMLKTYTPYIMYEGYLTTPAEPAAIKQAVTAKKADPIVFYSGTQGNPFSVGAYTGIKTYTPPKVQANDTAAVFEITDNYIHPDYVVCTPDEMKQDFIDRYGLVPVSKYGDLNIYEVTNKTTFSQTKSLHRQS